MESVKSNPPEVNDALEYWAKLEERFPILSKIACDVLVVPASSASIERCFSIAGYSCIRRRNRLSDSKLETEDSVN